MIRISNTQLFFLIMAFEVGSTTLFALGIGAERDAWIVVMTAALIGLCLAWVYTEIPQYYPNQNFSDILNVAIGKKLAFPLLFLNSIKNVLSIPFYSTNISKCRMAVNYMKHLSLNSKTLSVQLSMISICFVHYKTDKKPVTLR